MKIFSHIGANVRVDTTLKGFEQMNWQRGNQSFIFRGGSKCIELSFLPYAQGKTFRKESGNAEEVKHFNQRFLFACLVDFLLPLKY